MKAINTPTVRHKNTSTIRNPTLTRPPLPSLGIPSESNLWWAHPRQINLMKSNSRTINLVKKLTSSASRSANLNSRTHTCGSTWKVTYPSHWIKWLTKRSWIKKYCWSERLLNDWFRASMVSRSKKCWTVKRKYNHLKKMKKTLMNWIWRKLKRTSHHTSHPLWSSPHHQPRTRCLIWKQEKMKVTIQQYLMRARLTSMVGRVFKRALLTFKHKTVQLMGRFKISLSRSVPG